VEREVLQSLSEFAEGDLRRALNALETLVMGQALGGCVQMAQLEAFFRERSLRYDRAGDAHYDHISAMIKSIRGSDPDAALYWCFRMLASGEAPRFIARRLIILASEDVGLANSYALTVAVAAFEACEKVGLPECEYALAHAVLYLATAPKSNSITSAIAAVKAELKTGPAQAVPHWLWDQHAPRQAPANSSETYLYSHDYPHAISGQDYWTQPVSLYQPKAVGAEAAIQERLYKIAALKAQLKKERERAE
jgi:putative ATPase